MAVVSVDMMAEFADDCLDELKGKYSVDNLVGEKDNKLVFWLANY